MDNKNVLNNEELEKAVGGFQNRPSTGRCDFCGAEVHLEYDDSKSHGTEMSYRCPCCGKFYSELLG